MNTNMIGFRCIFRKSLHPCALDESSLSIGRVNGLIDAVNSVPVKSESKPLLHDRHCSIFRDS